MNFVACADEFLGQLNSFGPVSLKVQAECSPATQKLELTSQVVCQTWVSTSKSLEQASQPRPHDVPWKARLKSMRTILTIPPRLLMQLSNRQSRVRPNLSRLPT